MDLAVMVAILAGAGAFAVVAIAMTLLAFALRDAERRCADARVDAANKAGQLAIAAADIATQKNRADEETRRADALDDVLDEAATSGDAAGARGRVLARWTRARGKDPDAAHGDGPSPVSAPPAPVTARSGDDLAKPGD